MTDVKHEIPEDLRSLYDFCSEYNGRRSETRKQMSLLIERIAQLTAERDRKDVQIGRLEAELTLAGQLVKVSAAERDEALRECERQKEEVDLTKQLDKAKLPCGHNSRYGYTHDGGKTGDCCMCELSRLKAPVSKEERIQFASVLSAQSLCFDGGKNVAVFYPEAVSALIANRAKQEKA